MLFFFLLLLYLNFYYYSTDTSIIHNQLMMIRYDFSFLKMTLTECYFPAVRTCSVAFFWYNISFFFYFLAFFKETFLSYKLQNHWKEKGGGIWSGGHDTLNCCIRALISFTFHIYTRTLCFQQCLYIWNVCSMSEFLFCFVLFCFVSSWSVWFRYLGKHFQNYFFSFFIWCTIKTLTHSESNLLSWAR